MTLRQFIEHLESIERDYGPDLPVVSIIGDETDGYVSEETVTFTLGRPGEPAHVFVMGDIGYEFPAGPPRLAG
jgi:hypothetical protein